MPINTMVLDRPFTSDIIIQVNTSRMQLMPGLPGVTTGINKLPRQGPIFCSFMGLDADEHDPTFHGGIDKAVHGYCSRHYESWAEEYPESAHLFTPGGFGENLVTNHMNERNLCIGDILTVGPTLTLQVVLPRQPCFKLNHRFQIKNFAPQTYAKSRTGWYMKVLKEGWVEAGNEIRLVGRPQPEWSVWRVQEYLHRNTGDERMNLELSRMAVLGEEARNMFIARVAKAAAKKRREANKDKEAAEWSEYTLIKRWNETKRIIGLLFKRKVKVEKGPKDPEKGKISPGSWMRIRLPNGLVRCYSIVSGNINNIELGVALAENSRGGSKFIHDKLQVGDTISMGPVMPGIIRSKMASEHIIIAGGIGITAFIDIVERFHKIHYRFVLHYAVRSDEDIAYRDRLDNVISESGLVVIYRKDKGERMDINEILNGRSWNSHIYVCGPDRMLSAAKDAIVQYDVGESDIHFEAFTADISGDPFEVSVVRADAEDSNEKSTEQTLVKVTGEESMLDALRRVIPSIAASCEVGNCGTCAVKVLNGEVIHRGTGLCGMDKERMLPCVSRGVGRIVVEI